MNEIIPNPAATSGLQTTSLLQELWQDILVPGFVWQMLSLIACLLVAYLLTRFFETHDAARQNKRFSEAQARIRFPLIASLLLLPSSWALEKFSHANLLKITLVLLVALMLVRMVVFVLRHSLPRAAWLTAWERAISGLIWFWLALYITDTSIYAVDFLKQFYFSVGKDRIDLWMILNGGFAIFLTLILALWLASEIEKRLMQSKTLDPSLRIVIGRLTKAVLTLIAFVISFSMMGINMTALSIFTGTLGVGLGFGLQKVASNYISGFVILLDHSIRLGNMVQVGENSGKVTQITTRFTVLESLSGMEFIIPNEMLISSVVQNQMFSDNRVRVATRVSVAYDSDLDLVFRQMEESAKMQPRVLADPAPRVMLIEFADSGITLEMGFWITDPQEGKVVLTSDINLEIWRRFKMNGIEIPFPQRELRILQPVLDEKTTRI